MMDRQVYLVTEGATVREERGKDVWLIGDFTQCTEGGIGTSWTEVGRSTSTG
jgi:hypothetical protein